MVNLQINAVAVTAYLKKQVSAAGVIDLSAGWTILRLHNRYMYPMLETRAKVLKADAVEDVVSRESSTGWWSLWILWRRTRFLSAVAVDKHAPNPADPGKNEKN